MASIFVTIAVGTALAIAGARLVPDLLYGATHRDKFAIADCDAST